MKPNIFKNKKLIAFAGSTAHTVDIGGAPSPNAQDSYEEGLCIPICKIVEKGIENQVVIDFLQQNLREPEETLGDIRAQFSAYDVATKKLLTLLNEEKLNDFYKIYYEHIIVNGNKKIKRINLSNFEQNPLKTHEMASIMVKKSDLIANAVYYDMDATRA